MNHPNQEELILHHYGESPEAREIDRHLAECSACRQAYAELGAALGEADHLPVPWRGSDYGDQVWQRLRPRLETRPRSGGSRGPRLLAGLAVAASLVVAFLLGRHTGAPPSAPETPIPAAARERILFVGVGRHLERSQMVLVEIVTAGGDGPVDITAQQEWARELVSPNRLFRQSAVSSGEAAVASVLTDLERILVEIAAGPSQLSPEGLGVVRERIEDQGILLKVRVVGARARGRIPPAVGTVGQTSSS